MLRLIPVLSLASLTANGLRPGASGPDRGRSADSAAILYPGTGDGAHGDVAPIAYS